MQYTWRAWSAHEGWQKDEMNQDETRRRGRRRQWLLFSVVGHLPHVKQLFFCNGNHYGQGILGCGHCCGPDGRWRGRSCLLMRACAVVVMHGVNKIFSNDRACLDEMLGGLAEFVQACRRCCTLIMACDVVVARGLTFGAKHVRTTVPGLLRLSMVRPSRPLHASYTNTQHRPHDNGAI